VHKTHADHVVAHFGYRYDAAGFPIEQKLDVAKFDNYIDTENHPYWTKRKKFRYVTDRGGPVTINKNEILYFVSDSVEIKFPNLQYGLGGYRGFFRDATELAIPGPFTIVDRMAQWAPIAYDRMKPTKPSFDGVSELLELREVSLKLSVRVPKDPDLRKAVNGWLAVQFGWLPLLRTIRNLHQTELGWEKRLKWLLEHNGRPVRRRVHLETYSNVSPQTVTTGGATTTPVYPLLPAIAFQGTWTRRTWTEETRLIWASAQFRYWLPEGPRDVGWTFRMRRRIFGFGFSPAQVWAVVPWSWLIGWFTNASVLLRNLETSVADRLAADWFYVMGTQTLTNVTEVTFTTRASAWGPSRTLTVRQEHRLTRKERIRGDPFGFNTNPGSLSDLQLSILGALGYSRLR
jgi:hypothetical protein